VFPAQACAGRHPTLATDPPDDLGSSTQLLSREVLDAADLLYSKDVNRARAFYGGLGFTELSRYAPSGEPLNVELILNGFKLGIADVDAARSDHEPSPSLDGQAIELVLWCDTDAALAG
jgi:hypothetical protein